MFLLLKTAILPYFVRGSYSFLCPLPTGRGLFYSIFNVALLISPHEHGVRVVMVQYRNAVVSQPSHLL